MRFWAGEIAPMSCLNGIDCSSPMRDRSRPSSVITASASLAERDGSASRIAEPLITMAR